MGHDTDHPHEHEHLDHPGHFHDRDAPRARDFRERAFTVGIGGPVGSGKTALLLALCRGLRDTLRLGVVTNDIFTREDAEFLARHQALPLDRIRAVETGGCPHAAIREDITPRSAPTSGARSILLITSRSDCVMPGPPLRGTLSPPATSTT